MVDEYKDCHVEGYHLKIVPGLYRTRFLEMCCGMGGHAERSGWERVSSSPFTEVHRFEYEGEQYYRKKYLKRGWLEPVKAWVLGSRAQRAWQGGRLLCEHGLGTPDIVAAGWHGSDCFMVTRAAMGACGLAPCVQRLKMSASPQARRKLWNLAAELGRAVGRMHNQGISHGDLRWGNILVAEGLEERIEIIFLDNERTARYERLPRRKRLKNLVQLNMVPEGLLSRTDRMRFWRAYQAENRMPKGEQRKWIRRIIARTARRWARRAKKNDEPRVAGCSKQMS